MNDTVLLDEQDGLAILTLNRPEKLNALSIEVFEALETHIAHIRSRSDAIGCVLLRAAGRAFCAGADLEQIAARDRSGESGQSERKRAIIDALEALPQPVVAAVHGVCFTGGLELVLAADILIASENALFADTHGTWGLVGAWGLHTRLPRRVGLAKAKEMSLTAWRYSGQQAAAMGLVNVCVPQAEFENQVMAFTRAVLDNSWHSTFAAKRLMNRTVDLERDAALAYESYHHPGRAPDSEERVKRFKGAK